MKYAIFFLFLPLFAFGQSEIVKDSTFIKWEAGAWYRVVSQTFDNGNINLYQTFIGDTAALYNQAVDNIRNSTASMATDANYTSSFPKRLRTILNESDEILAKAGRSPVDSIENTDAAVFLDSGWTMKGNGDALPILFNKTAAGKLRYQYVTTTNNQVDLLGAVIRLRNFPTANVTTDFYRSPNGKRWVTLDRSWQLIGPGGSAAGR